LKVKSVRVKKSTELHYIPFSWDCPDCGDTNESTVLQTIVQYGTMNGIPDATVQKTCPGCDVDCVIELSIP